MDYFKIVLRITAFIKYVIKTYFIYSCVAFTLVMCLLGYAMYQKIDQECQRKENVLLVFGNISLLVHCTEVEEQLPENMSVPHNLDWHWDGEFIL